VQARHPCASAAVSAAVPPAASAVIAGDFGSISIDPWKRYSDPRMIETDPRKMYPDFRIIVTELWIIESDLM
jgi:hypothetical protein